MMNTFMKSAALTAAIALTGSAAFAANEFALQDNVMDSTTVEISNVTTDGAGTVVLYDYHGGVFGEVLGMAEVVEGANANLLITMDKPATSDIAAVLYVGEVTTPQESAAWIELKADS